MPKGKVFVLKALMNFKYFSPNWLNFPLQTFIPFNRKIQKVYEAISFNFLMETNWISPDVQ